MLHDNDSHDQTINKSIINIFHLSANHLKQFILYFIKQICIPKHYRAIKTSKHQSNEIDIRLKVERIFIFIILILSLISTYFDKILKIMFLQITFTCFFEFQH